MFQPALDTVQRRLEGDPKFAADVVAFLYPALRASRIAYRAYSKPCGYAGAKALHQPVVPASAAASTYVMASRLACICSS